MPRIDGHKYARGHAVVVSGDIAATGAARLSARGALRAGAGLVTLASPRDALAVNAAALTAVMVRAVDTVVEFAELLDDKRLNACVIGPGAGVGERTRDFVHTALSAKTQSGARCRCADEFCRCAGSAVRGDQGVAVIAQVVLTPHEGEFPRLFSDISNKHPGRSKLERVRAAAERSGAVVLLKGPDTVVASPDGRATIAANAPPWLATAGAGDVLAGIIAGLLAQGVPAFEAACIGVWMHGEAAREAGPGLIAEDLPRCCPRCSGVSMTSSGSSIRSVQVGLRTTSPDISQPRVSFHSSPRPGPRAVTVPSTILAGFTRIAPAKSRTSSQCAVGVTPACVRWLRRTDGSTSECTPHPPGLRPAASR